MKSIPNLFCENLADLKYQPGDTVYAISPKGEIYDLRVRWVNARLIKDEELFACLTSYECNSFNRFSEDIFDCTFYQDKLYATEQDAEKDAKFIPVEFSEDDWYKAIGLKDGVNRIDYDQECELSPCCAHISEIRNVLERVRENKGLIARERTILQELLDGHDSIKPSDAPKLFDILGTIGVIWKEI